MINYQLSLKFKLLKNGEFNYLIKILTKSSSIPCFVGWGAGEEEVLGSPSMAIHTSIWS